MATSDSPLSVPNVTLAVARPAGGGSSGGSSALAYSAPNGLADGEEITVTTDGSEGWDFGSAPSDINTWGFGQGFLYDQPLGTAIAGLTTPIADPISGNEWYTERDDTSRVVDLSDGLRASLTENPGGNGATGGWLGWALSSPLPENEKLYVSSVSKADWSFINTEFYNPIATVQSVDSATQITMTQAWSGSTFTNKRVILAPDPTDGTVIREEKLYLDLTNGSATATLNAASNTDFVQAGVADGDSVMDRGGVQWKGLRADDNGRGDIYWTNNNGFFGWPFNRGYVGVKETGAGQTVTKNWCRAESQVDLGQLGGNGTVKDRSINPSAGDGFASFDPISQILHTSTYRWKNLQFQEYIQYANDPKLRRADTVLQVGTFARVELANAPTPAETTNSNYLPPDIAKWGNSSITLYLWKGLLSGYSGNYLHFYDSEGVFRKAIAL